MFKFTTPTLSMYDSSLPDDPSTSSSASMRHHPDIDMTSDDGMAVPEVEQDEDSLGEGSSNFTSPGMVITSSSAFMRSVSALLPFSLLLLQQLPSSLFTEETSNKARAETGSLFGLVRASVEVMERTSRTTK